MINNSDLECPVVVVGSGRLACSITACLLLAGHRVTLLTGAVVENEQLLARHFQDIGRETNKILDLSRLSVQEDLRVCQDVKLAIGVSNEDPIEKKALLQQLEALFPPTVTLAVNAESLSLEQLQAMTKHPDRLVVANWVEPAHTTCFLELVSNEVTCHERVSALYSQAKNYWQKDPYWLQHGSGIRHLLMSALIREAFYLVNNGYATVEDIDRACRNDAGYYLSFAGNCRYMDLMGTYAYGMVMKDLNKELAKDQTVAPFFSELLKNGKTGMKAQSGFYPYEKDEADLHEETFRKFSYQIQQIMDKYPFNYKKETAYTGNTYL
jgi:3-hydroxybutyryl-CoA dehydrogenase